MYKNPYFNPAKQHHRQGGFQNNYLAFEGKRLRELLRWRWEAWRAGAPYPATAPIPIVEPDLGFIHTNGRAGLAMQPAMTWIGHITVLAQFGGLNVITDPVFFERCSPVQWAGPKRHTPPGLTMAQLPRIDVVLLSHSHYDHLDEASMVALAAQLGGPPLFSWFMKDQHCNPAESVQIFQDLGCKRALAVHWGTFQLTDEALDEPPVELAKALLTQNIDGQDFKVLAIGQTWRLPLRSKTTRRWLSHEG